METDSGYLFNDKIYRLIEYEHISYLSSQCHSIHGIRETTRLRYGLSSLLCFFLFFFGATPIILCSFFWITLLMYCYKYTVNSIICDYLITRLFDFIFCFFFLRFGIRICFLIVVTDLPLFLVSPTFAYFCTVQFSSNFDWTVDSALIM